MTERTAKIKSPYSNGHLVASAFSRLSQELNKQSNSSLEMYCMALPPEEVRSYKRDFELAKSIRSFNIRDSNCNVYGNTDKIRNLLAIYHPSKQGHITRERIEKTRKRTNVSNNGFHFPKYIIPRCAWHEKDYKIDLLDNETTTDGMCPPCKVVAVVCFAKTRLFLGA